MSLEEHIDDVIDATLSHVNKAVDGTTRLVVLGIEVGATDEFKEVDG